jgi:hypothetical protein
LAARIFDHASNELARMVDQDGGVAAAHHLLGGRREEYPEDSSLCGRRTVSSSVSITKWMPSPLRLLRVERCRR